MRRSLGVGVAALALIPVLIGGLLVFLLSGGPQPGAAVNGSGLSAVPEPYRALVTAAGQQCAEVPAAVVAAQIEAESGWNPNAVSPVGAQGLTQFMPATWAAYGVDGNNDGRTDPFDPADAIPAQARFMCALGQQMRPLAQGSGGELLKLILAGYNAGAGAVQKYRGVPPFPETQNYVTKIIQLAQGKYGQAAPSPSGSGGWVEPVPNPMRGTPFKKYGSQWRWKGWHTGADYPSPMGTRIAAIGPGRIAELRAGGSYGIHVIVDHGTLDGQRVQSLYAHMSNLAAGLKVGDPVQPGTALGYVGVTGNTSGPHLHLEVRLNWTGGANDAEFTDPWAWIDAHQGTATGTGGAAAALSFARQQIGTPYSWGGGSLTAPTVGFGAGAGTAGWDCSSLARASVYSGSGTELPRTTEAQVTQGTAVTGDPQAGDLVFFKLAGSSPGSGWDHVGIATGTGTMIHAPRTGKVVEEVSITSGFYGPDTTRTIRRVM